MIIKWVTNKSAPNMEILDQTFETVSLMYHIRKTVPCRTGINISLARHSLPYIHNIVYIRSFFDILAKNRVNLSFLVRFFKLLIFFKKIIFGVNLNIFCVILTNFEVFFIFFSKFSEVFEILIFQKKIVFESF